MEVKRTERGWAGHFICAHNCKFRRNTLLEYGDKKWIVSTVGSYNNPITGAVESIGFNRWYETMAFEAADMGGYLEAIVENEIKIDSECGIWGDTWNEVVEKYPNVDNWANDMHEKVVMEMIEKIKL